MTSTKLNSITETNDNGNEIQHYITLHYSDQCFQGKNFHHFTRVKRNWKDKGVR